MTRIFDSETVFAALLEVLRGLDVTELAAVQQTTLLRDVAGLDSLNLVYAVALLEERLGVEVDAGTLGTLRTASDIVRAIVAAKTPIGAVP